MKDYLFVGGMRDGTYTLVSQTEETIRLPIIKTPADTLEAPMEESVSMNLEIYRRAQLRAGDLTIIFYRHESLTIEQTFERLILYYKPF